MITANELSNATSADPLQATFLELLPKVLTHAEIYFRNIKCPARREDAIQETAALAWKWFRRLTEQGKDISQFPMVFIFLVAKGVKHGRHLTGMDKANDVMNPLAQQKHSFIVERLPLATRASHEELYGLVDGQEKHDAYEERLTDNTQTPVPDQAAFRIDFPAWRLTWTDRDRRLMDQLMLGERTQDVAQQFGLTPGRVSQKRLQFYQDWMRFTGEDALARA